MSRAHAAVAALLLSAVPAWAQIVLWDNGERDDSGGVISGRQLQFQEAWLVDDAVFEQAVTITGYRWFSLLDEGLQPVSADFIVLTAEFEKIVELRDMAFTSAKVGRRGRLIVYRMELSGLEITLPPSRYFLGARPVGQGEHGAYTATKYEVLGESEGYFRSVSLGYPDWIPISALTGSQRDIAFTVFGHVVRDEVEAESFTVPLGRLLGGEVSDLNESDDRYVTIRNRALMALTLPIIRMEVQGTTAVEQASRITVTVETAASNLPNQPLQRLALLDFAAGQWIIIDERPAPPVDTVVEVIIEDDPTRFIAPGAGQLRMRLDWLDAGATTPWGVRIDHATWVVER